MKRLVLLAAVILVTGCSSTPPLAPGETPQPPSSVSADCAAALVGLTDALFELDSRLNVGLAFAAYSEKLADTRVAYDKIKFSNLDADCLRGAAQPAESAMNEYIKAYTIWNDCISKTGCSNESIKPQLQAHWSTATSTLAEVKKRLP